MQRNRIAVPCVLVLLLLACQAVFPTAAGVEGLAGAENRQTPPDASFAGNIPTATPTQFAPFFAVAAVNNLNLRSHPGYLAPALGVIVERTPLLVVSRAPGGQWILVRTANGNEGWVFGALIKSDEDLQVAPVLVPDNAQMIRGRVLDAEGTPIRGVGFSATRGSGAKRQSDHALTDVNGDFYLYLPLNASGSWMVSHDSIACDSNVWAGADCTVYKEGYTGKVVPESLSVTVPLAEVLTFTWH
jgi:hypothetical protein